MRITVATALCALVVAGCVQPVDRAARCESLQEGIETCFGEQFTPILCDGLSDNDLVNLDVALQSGGCELFGDVIPADGDIRSSYCRVLGDGCIDAVNEPPLRRPTRYPIVLVNGIDLSPAFRYSERIVEVMAADGGHSVHLGLVTPYETPRRRAHVLWERIEEIRAETGAPKVNLVCHSLGGLDCRYLVSPGGLHWDVAAQHQEIADAVASITTIATAHYGTAIADASLGYLPDSDRSAAIDAFATFLGEWFSSRSLEDDVHLRDSVAALSEAMAPAFNAEIVDAEGVYYQSWAGFSRPFGGSDAEHDAALRAACVDDEGRDALYGFVGAHDYLATALIPATEIVGGSGEAFVPNDGLCTVTSARWGRFRGCIPADHMEQLGQLDLPDVNVRTGIDIAWFYAAIASDLAEMGF